MTLTRQTVEKVSLLARLALTDDELDTMTTQLADVIGYIELLSEVDTDAVEPMAHAIDVANVLADDLPRESLSRDKALSNAPNRDEQFYLVPPVLGD